MNFRARLLLALSLLTVLTLGAAFGVVMLVVRQTGEGPLDDALLAHALAEANHLDARRAGPPAFSDRPGPALPGARPMVRYLALYADDGSRILSSGTWPSEPPTLTGFQSESDDAFNFRVSAEHLRGILVPLEHHPGEHLLYAVSRADLDSDAEAASRAVGMIFLVAVAWTVLLSGWLVIRFTRGHEAIARVAQQVAAGNLAARAGRVSADRDTMRLAQDVDSIIDRLSMLLEAQRRFVAHAAHELRSPLTVLYGELSDALRKPREGDEYRRAIQEALDSTRMLKLLAEDLLTLARMGADRPEAPETTPFHEVVAECAEYVRKGRGGSVLMEVTAEAAFVAGQRRDLFRMVRNLVENAATHSPLGATVRLALTRQGAEVELLVMDDGPGVAPADRERIFEAFFRGAKERAEADLGAGLGLAIAREIARRHGGDVTLAGARTSAGEGAAWGSGATFVVRLPAASPP